MFELKLSLNLNSVVLVDYFVVVWLWYHFKTALILISVVVWNNHYINTFASKNSDSKKWQVKECELKFLYQNRAFGRIILNRNMLRTQYVLSFAFVFMVFNAKVTQTTALLYPRESETREIKSLDGIWNFVKSNQTSNVKTELDKGILDKWYLNDLSKVYKYISHLSNAKFSHFLDNLRYTKLYRCPFRPVTMI